MATARLYSCDYAYCKCLVQLTSSVHGTGYFSEKVIIGALDYNAYKYMYVFTNISYCVCVDDPANKFHISIFLFN